MTLKTSLIITGDSSVARQAVIDLQTSIEKLGNGATAAKAPIAQVDQAQTAAAASARQGAAAATQLGDANQKAAGGARDLAQSIDKTATAQTGGSNAARVAAQAQQSYAQSLAKTAADVKPLVAANDQVAASTAAAQQQLGAIEGAQQAAANGATAHAAAAAGLQGELATMLAQIAGGASVFEAMETRGGAFAAALAEVASASKGAKVDIEATGDSGKKAGVDLGGLGEAAVDAAGKAGGMGAGLGSVAAIMSGPFGVAAGIAINVVGSLAVELIASKSALEGEMEALRDNAVKTDLARQAKESFGKTQAGIMADVRALTDEINRQNDSLRTNAERQNLRAKSRIDQIGENRDDVAKRLKTARDAQAAIERSAPASFGGAEARSYASRLATAKSAVAELDRQLKSIDVDLSKAQVALQASHLAQAQENAKSAGDAIAAINKRYDAEELRLSELKKREIALGREVGAATQRQFDDIERRRKKAIADEEKRQAAAAAKVKAPSLGNQIEAGSAASILSNAERYRGLSENNAADRDKLRDLFKQGEMGRVDPTITAWCAAFVNSVLAQTGIKGTGSLSARSFLGYGSSTDTPNKGDIVVSRRGNDPAKGHVGFYQGTDAKGRVLVLGGNTGDRVGTQAVPRSDVLGFRRAPSAADAYKDSQTAAADANKAAADAAKALQRDLDQVIAKYLPATAAAKDYADELARINALAASYDGKDPTSGLTAGQADAARAALKAANDKRMAEISLTPEAKAADDARKSIDGVVASLTKELAVRKTLDPVQQAMADHQAELAKLSGEERAAYEAKLVSLYDQREAYTAVEEATRAAADAQRYLQESALGAFDAIVFGGEKAGKVLERVAKSIASAALEAAVLGTGPLTALFSGASTATAASRGGSTAQATVDALGKSVGRSVGSTLAGLFGGGNQAAAAAIGSGSKLGSIVGTASQAIPPLALAYTASSIISDVLGLKKTAGGLFGVVGNALGTLFAGSKTSSAAIRTENGAFVAAKGTGSTGALASQAGSAAGTVAATLQQIAEQLGAAVGSVSGITIGTKNGKWHVNSVGGQIGKKGSGDIGFGKDGEAEAYAYAIQQAIAKGAITGLSDAVQKAINSSTDVNKSLAEALKVQELELLMGGVNAQIDKAFRDFETQAKERVRLASAYGFDVVAIEKRNGEDRAKLAQQLAANQVGSLQKLIEEMTQGSLFEGTAMDRITALNTAIGKAKADLAAGMEGAGDTLASLYQQRLAASKDAYGSTSGYAADRTATLDEARAAVAAANARIVAAQNGPATSDPALATTNATLDEISDQTAKLISQNTELQELLTRNAAGAGTGRSFNLAELAKY